MAERAVSDGDTKNQAFLLERLSENYTSLWMDY